MMKQETSTETVRSFRKDSDDEARMYDTDGYWLRAACVCVKVRCLPQRQFVIPKPL